jgi:hypothetical protein
LGRLETTQDAMTEADSQLPGSDRDIGTEKANEGTENVASNISNGNTFGEFLTLTERY